MAKPTILPIWNTDETNSTEPDAAHKLDGWLAPGGVPEKPPFQTFNFWQNSVYKWIAWIEEFFNPSLDKSIIHNITTDANYTLTNEQAEFSRLEITDTGVVLTTGRDIICNNIEHTFLFVNSTAQTLTIKNSTGTGIEVLAGEARQVRNDTINVILHEEIYGIGVDQTWQDVTLSRSASVVYTNTTGKPIMVAVNATGGSSAIVEVEVDGLFVSHNSNQATANMRAGVTIVVPNGSTYEATLITGTLSWYELR